jgi:hypothetical protein
METPEGRAWSRWQKIAIGIAIATMVLLWIAFAAVIGYSEYAWRRDTIVQSERERGTSVARLVQTWEAEVDPPVTVVPTWADSLADPYPGRNPTPTPAPTTSPGPPWTPLPGTRSANPPSA